MPKNKKSNLILVADEFGLDTNNEYLPIFPKSSKINRKRFNYNDNKKLQSIPIIGEHMHKSVKEKKHLILIFVIALLELLL